MHLIPPFISRRAGSVSLWSGGLSILCMPVSISFSQALYALALVSMLLSPSGLRVSSPGLRRVLYVVLLLSGFWALSATIHAFQENSPAPLSALLRSDWKDVLLSGMAIWVYHHAGHSEEHRRTLYRFLAIGFAILLFSGIVAVFTPFRLSRVLYHLQHGWAFSAQARLQHPIFRIPLGPYAVVLHMPVGFLGTHLAYGAQLGLYFVPLALFSIDRIVRHPSLRGWSRFDTFVLLLNGLTLFVLFLNSARSALFGILSALLAGVLILTGNHWKKKAWVLALPVLLALILAAGGLALAGRSGAARDFIMQSVGLEKKHSDYQRVLLWSTVVGLIERQPWTGSGPGRFSDAILDEMNSRSDDRPFLWYLYMQAERGHAHNDFLYQLAVAGIPAGIAYIGLWLLILQRVFYVGPDGAGELALSDIQGEQKHFLDIQNLDKRFAAFLPFAPVSLLFGGMFQCYFLDDQVLLPFWLMIGLAFQAREGLTTRG